MIQGWRFGCLSGKRCGSRYCLLPRCCGFGASFGRKVPFSCLSRRCYLVFGGLSAEKVPFSTLLLQYFSCWCLDCRPATVVPQEVPFSMLKLRCFFGELAVCLSAVTYTQCSRLLLQFFSSCFGCLCACTVATVFSCCSFWLHELFGVSTVFRVQGAIQ